MAKFFPGETIGKSHGKAHREGNVIHYAMYHPAAALHQQSLRQIIQADMLNIPSLLAQTDKVPETEEKSQQLSLL
jgi:DNA polymerase